MSFSEFGRAGFGVRVASGAVGVLAAGLLWATVRVLGQAEVALSCFAGRLGLLTVGWLQLEMAVELGIGFGLAEAGFGRVVGVVSEGAGCTSSFPCGFCIGRS